MSGLDRLLDEKSLIIEARDARNPRPKFHAQFGVAEEGPDGQRVGLPQ